MRRTSESRLAENILLFCRTLRKAGLPIGPGKVLEAIGAVACAGIARRDDFYWALRSVLVNDPSQFRLFDQAFHIFFRNPRLLERMMALLLPRVTSDQGEASAKSGIRRLLEALSDQEESEDNEALPEIDRAGSYSHREILRRKDFEQMSLQELADARQLLRDEMRLINSVATRRFRPSSYGQRYDLRRSMRQMLRNSGQVIELPRKQRRKRPPNVVLICDISGSMTRYSRMFLHFAHTISSCSLNVQCFVFGTRLTNITRRLADRDVDKAMARISDEVKDFDGGTRIAACLKWFNVDWGRRVLARDAVVVLLSDGLERDPESDLEFQMQRLQKSCRSLIWMNPMLRYDAFEPKASGIRRMLPHVDAFVPSHNVNSLVELGRMLRHEPAESLPGMAEMHGRNAA